MKPARLARYGEFVLGFPFAYLFNKEHIQVGIFELTFKKLKSYLECLFCKNFPWRLTVIVPEIQCYFDITYDNFENKNTNRIVGTWR